MRFVIFFWLTITCTPLYPSISRANNLNFYHNVFDVYQEKIHPRIVGRLSNEEYDIIKDLSFEMIENSRIVTLAGTDKYDKRIIVSVGFLHGIFNYAECLLLEGQFNQKNITNNYFQYFLGQVTSTDPNPPLPAAHWYFKNNEDGFQRWISNPALTTARNTMLMSALINVMVHEYGHHIIGFSEEGDSISDIRRLEAQVDIWAYETLNEIGEKPTLGAAISLGYISQIERYRRVLRERSANDPNFQELTRIHPLPKERAEWAYEYACGDFSNSSELQRACGLIHRTIDDFE